MVARMQADEEELTKYFGEHVKPDRIAPHVQHLTDLRALISADRWGPVYMGYTYMCVYIGEVCAVLVPCHGELCACALFVLPRVSARARHLAGFRAVVSADRRICISMCDALMRVLCSLPGASSRPQIQENQEPLMSRPRPCPSSLCCVQKTGLSLVSHCIALSRWWQRTRAC